MLTLKRAIVPALAATALLCAAIVPASAVVISPGDNPTPPTATIGSNELAADAFVGGVPYEENWFFNVTNTANLTANATVSNASFGLKPLVLQIWSDGGTIGSFGAGDALIATISAATGGAAVLASILLNSPGDYLVRVTSNGVNALKDGLVNGNIDLAAVPIPGALPLFASGLAGLGLLAWRRKRKAGPVSAAA